MKGLQHNVIEIKDTDNEGIEKILVFLKPGQNKIDIANTGRDARDILQKVKVHRRMPEWITDRRFIAAVFIFGIIMTVMAVLFA